MSWDLYSCNVVKKQEKKQETKKDKIKKKKKYKEIIICKREEEIKEEGEKNMICEVVRRYKVGGKMHKWFGLVMGLCNRE